MFAATPATATGKPRLISHTIFMTITEEAAIDATLSTRFHVFGLKKMRDVDEMSSSKKYALVVVSVS